VIRAPSRRRFRNCRYANAHRRISGLGQPDTSASGSALPALAAIGPGSFMAEGRSTAQLGSIPCNLITRAAVGAFRNLINAIAASGTLEVVLIAPGKA
jgi:hypothetical protein